MEINIKNNKKLSKTDNELTIDIDVFSDDGGTKPMRKMYPTTKMKVDMNKPGKKGRKWSLKT